MKQLIILGTFLLVGCSQRGDLFCDTGSFRIHSPGGDTTINEVSNLEELLSRSAAVIHGRVESAQVICRPNPTWVETINTLQILEVFQGDLTVGGLVTIYQAGGRTFNVNIGNALLVNLPVGKEVVLFLSYDGANRLTLSNPSVVYLVEENQLVELSNRTDFLLDFSDLR